VQQRILAGMLAQVPAHGAAHGFVRGRNCVRRGAAGENRSAHPDFRAHLLGRIAHIAQLHPALGTRLLALFDQIRW
jgi:hypothetical protein